MSWEDFLKWNKQGEDTAGEIWICRGGWVRGKMEQWAWGAWGAVIGKNGIGGGAATGVNKGTATSLLEGQRLVEEFYLPEVAAQVEQVLMAEEGQCRNCGEFKPLKPSTALRGRFGYCFPCAEMMPSR